MLVKLPNRNQFDRDLVDTADKKEVWIYNQHQKVLTDNVLFAIGEDETPEFFLEVLTPDEDRHNKLIEEIIGVLNEKSE